MVDGEEAVGKGFDVDGGDEALVAAAAEAILVEVVAVGGVGLGEAWG